MATVSIQLPAELAARLKAVTDLEGKTPSQFALDAILEAIEDAEDVRVAEAVLGRVRSGEERIWTQEEVEREYDLEGSVH